MWILATLYPSEKGGGAGKHKQIQIQRVSKQGLKKKQEKCGMRMRGDNLENERLLVNTHQHTPTQTQRASEEKN